MINYGTWTKWEQVRDKNQKEIEDRKLQCISSMRGSLALRNANNIWGNGFVFNSEEENIVKIFNAFDKRNRLKDLFHYAETIKSQLGRVIITMNKTPRGIMLNIADPHYYNGVGKSFVSETLSVLFQRVVTDNRTFILKSTYTTEYVENEWFNEDGKTLIYDVEAEIPKQFRVEKRWNHNLGFLPLLESFNYPFRTIFYNQFNFEELTDWWHCSFLEELFFDIKENLRKEINYCHSRIAIENATQEILEQLNQNGGDLGDYIISTDVGSKATAIAGVGDFIKYTNAMNEVMDFYYKFSNSSKFSEGGGAQKSSTEAATARSSTVETITQKITHNESDYTQLIAKCLIAEGANFTFEEDYPFQFEINGNIQKDDTVYLDNIIKQVNLGTMSMVEAIANLRNLNQIEAQQIFDSIKEFNEENEMITSMSGGAFEEEGDNFEGSSPQREGGRIPDNEKGQEA